MKNWAKSTEALYSVEHLVRLVFNQVCGVLYYRQNHISTTQHKEETNYELMTRRNLIIIIHINLITHNAAKDSSTKRVSKSIQYNIKRSICSAFLRLLGVSLPVELQEPITTTHDNQHQSHTTYIAQSKYSGGKLIHLSVKSERGSKSWSLGTRVVNTCMCLYNMQIQILMEKYQLD